MDWVDLALSAARGASLAALLSAFGTLVFRLAVLPAAPARPEGMQPSAEGRALRRLTAASLLAAAVLSLLWLVLQSAAMSGASDVHDVASALPIVVLHTRFGHILLLRLLVLAAALPLLSRGGRWPASAASSLVGVALLLQIATSHAAAMGGLQGAGLAASEAMHLLAAGGWLGGLLPLFATLRRASPQAARAMSRGFTPIGLGCVVLLAGTGLLQASILIGGLPGVVGTAYGRVALLKLVLFAALLALATANRFVFTERLASADAQAARRRLLASVATETVLGLAVVLAAGRLASLAPAIHEQPVWPFAVRPSLEAFADPDLGREVGSALLELAAAIVLAVAAIAWRRLRWPGAAAAVLLAGVAIPHLDLLFVPAYPSSFFTSPTEFGDSGIVNGAHLFARHCASCHGDDGRGGGPVSKTLAVPPADLTAEHLWAHSDGELFWWLSHGMDGPDGGLSMPGFASTLSSDARWNVIDYLRAHNAGESMRLAGTWPHAVPVPQFDAICPGGHRVDTDDLRGRPLLIVAGDPTVAIPDGPAMTTVVLRRGAPSGPNPTNCVAAESESWEAFAILLGVSSDALAGSQVLADRNGWLRAAASPETPGGWIGDAAALAKVLAYVDANPVQAMAGPHHH